MRQATVREVNGTLQRTQRTISVTNSKWVQLCGDSPDRVGLVIGQPQTGGATQVALSCVADPPGGVGFLATMPLIFSFPTNLGQVSSAWFGFQSFGTVNVVVIEWFLYPNDNSPILVD